MQCILCIGLYALYFMHCFPFCVFYDFYSMQCVLCLVFYALHSTHFILCNVFYALYSIPYIVLYALRMYSYIYIVFYELYSMHCMHSMHCTVIMKEYNLLLNSLVTDQQTNRPTDGQTDIVLNRAAIAAKKDNSYKQDTHTDIAFYIH